jgi:Cupredoxin-like domain
MMQRHPVRNASEVRRVAVPTLLGMLLAASLAGCSSSKHAANPAPPSVVVTATSTPSASLGAQGSGRGAGGEGRGEGGGEGNDAGEGGRSAAPQRLNITLSDSGITPTSLSATAGVIELDVANQGQQAHQVTVVSGGTAQNLGSVAAGQTLKQQANLAAGTYTIELDASTRASPVPSAILRVQ